MVFHTIVIIEYIYVEVKEQYDTLWTSKLQPW